PRGLSGDLIERYGRDQFGADRTASQDHREREQYRSHGVSTGTETMRVWRGFGPSSLATRCTCSTLHSGPSYAARIATSSAMSSADTREPGRDNVRCGLKLFWSYETRARPSSRRTA